MVRVFDRNEKKVKADVIILGCSLPGIVAAHKLKNRFGNTMDIVVLDLAEPNRKQARASKCGVIFQEIDKPEVIASEEEEEAQEDQEEVRKEKNDENQQKNGEEKDNEETISQEMKIQDEKSAQNKYWKKKTEENKKGNVEESESEKRKEGETDQEEDNPQENETTQRILNSVARFFLEKLAREFKLPLPVDIISPMTVRSPLTKLFQDFNGKTIECHNDYHDFDHLSFFEKFELNQYHTRLDNDMKNLFQTKENTRSDRNRLLYYDRTTMETDICDSLFFDTSREIMRMAVRLVCGASADTVSLLFYLHQCFRTNSSRNHLDGENTRLREKLLGYCRKRLANKLQQSIADITMQVKPITEIRTCEDAKVILETRKGDIFVCNLLAMALKPDELDNIEVGEELLSSEEAAVTKGMIPGRTKKFLITYNENIWGQQGYSGDIISIRGPIIWAMEMPELSTTGRTGAHASLVGFLKLDLNQTDSREAVIEQLVKLFGEGAAEPFSYKETDISDVYIPRCGDYVALRRLTGSSPRNLEWGALDIFADGDLVAALEAGHSAYINLMSSLRPQAQTFEDASATSVPTVLSKEPFSGLLSHINYISGLRWSTYLAATYIAVTLLFKYMRRE